ncbi:PREDICTED: probable LRR receptor-like serine/threonine-protein kinase At5g45780 isoform X4 [Tarenaya hassleriana]|uniref:probable LRR receptor-like serine/threonine-protein kinase At5g45780 isoform X4 n=1 Tax=Tarenaya hassleriana TaxID=28532 RepID=UPI00053C836D|nr:PREDICTED: probable LRR receptor-like serine/threonine-protein kinase At5g45780 isoform X4 [Tarenaya hassleriana]
MSVVQVSSSQIFHCACDFVICLIDTRYDQINGRDLSLSHSHPCRRIHPQRIRSWPSDTFLFLGCLFCWVDSISATDSLLSPKGVNYEVAALMSVKNKMRDDEAVMEGWDINSVDPCTWNMVGCSAEGFVVSIEMASKGLSGTISASIGELTHLRTLLLQNNQLTGPIPSELGQLTELETLDLSGGSAEIFYPDKSLALLLTSQVFLSSLEEVCSNVTKLKDVSGLSEKDKSDNHHSWVLSFAFGIGVAFIVSLMFVIFWVLWNRSRLAKSYGMQQDYEFEIGHLKRFTFRELQTATSNFSPRNILGQGGFGVVYKGYLSNGTVVAVKRLKDPNYTGEVQFQTEVELIGLAVHRNLLRLYGFCMTPEERLLVYPYMPNGSVADRLRDNCGEKPSLDWNRRIWIALGAARGLVYLHEQCNPKIIHRDVKAANILLDETFEAVVGDFGLAKLLDQRDSHVTTAVRGTIGHIAPEYLSTGQSSEKTDVFGFGILILELITGHKMLEQGNSHVRKGMILNWVRTLKAEERLEEMVDRDLKGEFEGTVMEKAVELALLCTQPHPNQRLRMSEVLKVLEGLVDESGIEERSGGGRGGYEDRVPSVSRNYSGGHEDSSFVIEAIELSGPR